MMGEADGRTVDTHHQPRPFRVGEGLRLQGAQARPRGQGGDVWISGWTKYHSFMWKWTQLRWFLDLIKHFLWMCSGQTQPGQISGL